jgi:hypothetical protein
MISAADLPAVVPPTTVLPTPSPLPGLNNLTQQQRATFVQAHHEAFQAGRVNTATQSTPQAPAQAGTVDQVQQSLAPSGVGINVSQAA